VVNLLHVSAFLGHLQGGIQQRKIQFFKLWTTIPNSLADTVQFPPSPRIQFMYLWSANICNIISMQCKIFSHRKKSYSRS